MTRSALFLAITLGLSLAACQDTRRDAVRNFLEAHPPENFALAGIPDTITIARGSNGGDESVLKVKYRLVRPTMELRDALAEPRAVEISRRIAAVRGWALASLSAGDPARAEITAASANARAPIPVKHIVTPAGAEIETLAVLKLSKTAAGWQVTPESLDAHVPGQFDINRDIPLEHSPEAVAKLDALDALAQKLEDTRKKTAEDRQRDAERSLAALRSLLQTGNTFEGEVAGSAHMQLVVTHGFDAGDPVAVVITVQRAMQSSARYVGTLAQEPSGESVWRAAQVTSLSDRQADRFTDPTIHPILTLSPAPASLIARFTAPSQPVRMVMLSFMHKSDLIPEPNSQRVP